MHNHSPSALLAGCPAQAEAARRQVAAGVAASKSDHLAVSWRRQRRDAVYWRLGLGLGLRRAAERGMGACKSSSRAPAGTVCGRACSLAP